MRGATLVGGPLLLALAALLWGLAATGFMLAGGGLMGASWIRGRVPELILVATVASLSVLAITSHPEVWIGGAMDALVGTFAAIALWRRVAFQESPGSPPGTTTHATR
jgi:hypothetical protein